MYKQPQKIIIHYATQKYDLKRSQSGIPHRQMTSKDHNPVFHMDKRPQKIIIRYSTWTNDLKRSQSPDKQPQKVTIWYSAQKNDLKRSQSGIPHRQMTSKDHNPVFHTDK